MTAARRRIGREAENLTASRLIVCGWEILERNARTRYGELDIVALDASTLVFVEVKAGRPDPDFGPERPILAIGPRKQRQVRRLAAAWMAAQRGSLPGFTEIRFDAVGVLIGGGSPEIEHLRAAF
jgi:putative endonuclease